MTRVYTPSPGSPNELEFQIGEIARLGRALVDWKDEPGARRTWRPPAAEDHARVLVINEGHPPLTLAPSKRSDRRLQVSYRVDADRRLRWTVTEGQRTLKNDEPLATLR